MNRFAEAMGRGLARYLDRRTRGYVQFSVTPMDRLRAILRPGDVILIEGDKRISAAIKYLTHSTWSHAAFFIGETGGHDVVEADLQEGVRYASLTDYAHLNTRVCRPVGLLPEDLARVLDFMHASIGRTYDLKNVVDLARFLMPQPPVPRRFRRKLLALGSGDPTRAICSTLIAEAFQRVSYPILPELRPNPLDPKSREVLRIRHHSLFTPRDFDLSPYFAIVKPTIERGFDYRGITWYDPTE